VLPLLVAFFEGADGDVDVLAKPLILNPVYEAKFDPGSEAEEYSRIASEEMCRRMGIKPGSVAYNKLARLNQWTGKTGKFRDSNPRTEIVRTPIDFLRHLRLDAQIDKVGSEFSL
jgi:hypothetical protein